MFKPIVVLLFVVSGLFSSMAISAALSDGELQKLLEKRFAGSKVTELQQTEIPSLYFFKLGGEFLYVTDDGKYIFKGQMLDIQTSKIGNVSLQHQAFIERKHRPTRKASIDNLDEDDMVVFKAPNEQYVITVFTDVDCGYCQKLHKERKEYLDLGITIRYLGFPRAGIGSPSGRKLQGIWCADNPQKAMTDAKVWKKYRTDRCKTPFNEHMQLVNDFGLSGTPSIVLENGQLFGGYQPAKVLRSILDRNALEEQMQLMKKNNEKSE